MSWRDSVGFVHVEMAANSQVSNMQKMHFYVLFASHKWQVRKPAFWRKNAFLKALNEV